MRVLLIAFYFPPAGGGGVQRPLKLAAHLPQFGIETEVLAPDDPKWIHRDEELRSPEGVPVTRARYLGPRGRLPAEELYGKRGFDRLLKRLALAPRRFVLPDENASWALTAVPRGDPARPAERHRCGDHNLAAQFDQLDRCGRETGDGRPLGRRSARLAVCEAGPRHRSPGGANEGAHSGKHRTGCRRPRRRRRRDNAEDRRRDEVAEALASGGDDSERFGFRRFRRSRIPSGGALSRITHTGSFFGTRSPRPFLQAFEESDEGVVARFVGDFRAADRDWAAKRGLTDRLELHPFLSHQRALELQRNSEALLLLLPDVGERGRDVPSGKLFEYLAARRPILAAVPTDGTAAKLIRETKAGIVTAPNDIEGMRAAIAELVARRQAGVLEVPPLDKNLIARIGRVARSGEFAALLHEIGSR